MDLVGIRYSADHTYTLHFPCWSAAGPLQGWHSHQMTSTGCGLSDGLSGRMFRTAGEEGGSEEGGERTVEGRKGFCVFPVGIMSSAKCKGGESGHTAL